MKQLTPLDQHFQDILYDHVAKQVAMATEHANCEYWKFWFVPSLQRVHWLCLVERSNCGNYGYFHGFRPLDVAGPLDNQVWRDMGSCAALVPFIQVKQACRDAFFGDGFDAL